MSNKSNLTINTSIPNTLSGLPSLESAWALRSANSLLDPTPIPRPSANIVSTVLEEISSGATAYGMQGEHQPREDLSIAWQQQPLHQQKEDEFFSGTSAQTTAKKYQHSFAVPEFTTEIPPSSTVDPAALEQALGEVKRSSRARVKNEQ
eukprot:m.425468 g.425468  ORF g.425468 m.425468 type:complete len:149 (-) comp21346_c0_seq14:1527-1973(-)